jgi:hypothetical protein
MQTSHTVVGGGSSDKENIVLALNSLDTFCDFMSGELEEVFEADTTKHFDDCRMFASRDTAHEESAVWTAVQDNSPATATCAAPEITEHPFPFDDLPKEQTSGDAQTTLFLPARSERSKPPSNDGVRLAQELQAPATLQSDIHNLMTIISSSDTMEPTHRSVDVESSRSATSSTKLPKQAPARLDQAIQKGEGPPSCENCGSIETPAWRRAWSKEFEGNETAAEEIMRDSSILFWLALEYNTHGEMQKFKTYKKNLEGGVNGWVQMLFCNPCGLWLYKAKGMRPENKWNKQLLERRREFPSRNRENGPLSFCRAAETRSMAASKRIMASLATSPEVIFAPAEARMCDVGNNHDTGDEEVASPCIRLYGTSAEPHRSTNAKENSFQGYNKMKELRRAIQSGPAEHTEVRPNIPRDDSIFLV